jgi:hypothetical protein
MKKLIFTLIMALVVGAGVKVEGATTYLANGDLRAAVSGATDGDVIILTGDTYSWATLLNNYTKSITVKASPSLTTRPVVTFSSTAGAFMKCTPAALKTITFDGIDFNGAGIATGLITPAAASGGDLALTINNCVVRNISGSAAVLNYTAQATLNAGYSNLNVTNSRFIGFVTLTPTTGTITSTPKNATFRNCYFSTYQSAGANMYTNGAGTGCDVTFDHCTINKGPSGTKRIFYVTGAGSVTIVKNCIIANELTGTSGVAQINANAASANNTFYLCIGTLSTRFPNMGTYTDTADPGIPSLPAVGSLTANDADYFTNSGKGYYNNTVLTKSVSTLSGFAYNEGEGPSTPASQFTVSGTDLFNNISITAPTNYEISSDNSTFGASLTFSPTLGVVTTQTVYVRLKAVLNAGSYSGDITVSTGNLSNQTIALSGTVSAGGSPAFTTSTGSLTGFNYIYSQGPSVQQSFTVSGSNLTSNVAITAPTNYEVSTTSGSGFGASASIPFGSGTLSAVPVYVRLKAGLNSGSYNSENIALTSTGATEQGVSCSGSVTPPTITITPTSLSSFFVLTGSAIPSAEKTFTVSGSNLAGNITVTPPTNYEISTATGGSFSATNPITLSPSSGTLASTTIYVRLKGSLATASYNENITVATAGASNSTVACSGIVATPVVKVGTSAGTDNKTSLASLSYAYGAGPSTSQTGMFVSGDYLQGDVTVTAPTGFEVSKDDITFAPSVTFTVSNQTVSGQVWNRLKAGLNADTYGGNLVYSSIGAANRNVLAAGSVTGGPKITTGALAGSSSTYSGNNGPSIERTFTVTGTDLASDVTITPPTNFEVSLTTGSGFSLSPITLLQANATAGATIYLRLKAGLSINTYSESITLSATNANSRTVALTGSVTAANPVVTVTPIGTYTYNNTPQGPTVATNTGTGSSYTFSYAGTGNTTYGPSATLPTNAGTYTATATVAANGNFAQASSAATAFSILSTGAVSAANTNISSLTLSPSSVLTVSGTGSLVLDANTNVSSITVAAGGELSIPSSSTTVSGTITLQSSASGTATLVDDYASPTRTATVQQYLSSARNWYFTPALTGVVVPASSTYFGYEEAGDNEDLGATGASAYWKPYATGASLTAGKGYIIQSGGANTLSFTNTTVSGDVSPILTYNSGKGNGYNLVGNPYPSYLSWSAVYNYDAANGSTANMPTGTIWYRTVNYNEKSAWTGNTPYSLNEIVYNGTRFYKVTVAGTSAASGGPTGTTAGITDGGVTWNYQGSVYVFATVSASGVATPSMVNNLLPPMQAFWVKTATGGGTLRFKNSMRSHNTTGGTNALKAPKSAASDMKLIRLNVSNGASADEAVIYASANASNAFDSYDAPKYFNTAGSNQAEIYTQVGTEKLVINAMNELSLGTEIPLGFATEKANDFTISASELKNFGSDTKVILKDNQTSTEFDLTTGQAYTFSSSAVNSTNRFSLLFRAPGTTTGIESNEKLNAQVYVNAANQIVIVAPEKAIYSIYNAVGQLIENGVLNTKHETRNTKHASGVYVVKVANHSTRVIIK